MNNNTTHKTVKINKSFDKMLNDNIDKVKMIEHFNYLRNEKIITKNDANKIYECSLEVMNLCKKLANEIELVPGMAYDEVIRMISEIACLKTFDD